jgi:hypothetical protein
VRQGATDLPIAPAGGDRDDPLLFVFALGVNSGMSMPTFSEYVAMREGVLSPTRPPLAGMTRLNASPTTAAHWKRLRVPKPMEVPKPFKPVARMKPTVRHVTAIVPQSIIPKLKPPLAGSLPQRASQLI